MHTTLLSSFTELVPVCSQSAPVSTVLHLLSQAGCERVVVVDARKQPVGLLNWPVLVAYLSVNQPLTTPGEPTSDEPSAIAALHLQQSLATVAPPIITPLSTLPAAWSLSQFWSHLQGALPPSTVWALVDPAGEFLGLLNESQLLQALTPLLIAHSETGLGETQPSPGKTGLEPSTTAAPTLPNQESGMREKRDATLRVLYRGSPGEGNG